MLASNGQTTSYTYDDLNRLTNITDPASGNTVFTYDAKDRLTSVKDPKLSATTSYTVASLTVDGSTALLSAVQYFPFGGVSKWTWGNGQAYERTFDLDGRIKTLTLGPSTGTYADLGQVFGYDSLNRLVSANLAAGQTQGFTYDANSNRLTQTVNAATTTYTYPSTSHKLSSLSGATTRSFTYDNAGNVTNSQSITYAYDGRGRMKQAGAVPYLVNGLGQRVKKNNGTDIFFAYDEAGRLLGEYDASGAPIQETVWLGDQPVATIRPASPSGFNVFYVWGRPPWNPAASDGHGEPGPLGVGAQ